MNNVIAYIAQKNKTMAHSVSLNNRISCIVGISISGFKTYWKRVFYLMEIQTTSTFEQFLQAETLNAKKNKSYYQRYDVKRLRAFHKQAMIKQQIYYNMLARRSGMDYSKLIQFQTSLINDLFQPKMSTFSTRVLIWVRYKVVHQFSQLIFSFFSYLNSALHN